MYNKYEGYILIHHGIKGQKWGVRRTKQQLQYDRYSILAHLDKRVDKIKTPNHIRVKSISRHSLDRIETREDRKVTAKDIMHALEKPLHIGNVVYDKYNRPSIRYIGNKATVNLNPENGTIATVWKTSSKAIKKYSKKEE